MRTFPTALTSLCLLSSLGACKRIDIPAEQQGPATSTGGQAADAGEAPDKPTPIAGAYLTSIITKPTVSTTIDICLQVRTANGQRLDDQVVDKGTWTYVLPSGQTVAGLNIKIIKLTNRNQQYYCHADMRVQVPAGAVSSTTLALVSATSSATSTSSSTTTTAQIPVDGSIRSFTRSAKVAFKPAASQTSGSVKTLVDSQTPYQQTISSTNATSPTAIPAFVGLAGALAQFIGGILSPPPTSNVPNDGQTVQQTSPTDQSIVSAAPPQGSDSNANTFDNGSADNGDYSNWSYPQTTQYGLPADETGAATLYSPAAPSDPTAPYDTGVCLQNDPSLRQPYALPPGVDNSLLLDDRISIDSFSVSMSADDIRNVKAYNGITANGYNSDGSVGSVDRCPNTNITLIMSAPGLVRSGPYAGCAWPCEVPPPYLMPAMP